MNSDAFQNLLLDAMKEKVPKDITLASILMDILSIGKEAVYRRLRGEVPFTFMETAIISQELGISLDAVVGTGIEKSRPFQIRLIEYADPLEIDYSLLEGYSTLLASAQHDPYSELLMATNTLPQPVFTRYDHLSRFFMFKWAYHYLDGVTKSFDKINISKRLKDVQARSGYAHLMIRTTNYIFDNLLASYLVNDIKYFAGIGLISDVDVAKLKDELYSMLNYLEKLSAEACFENGNKLNIYISNINLESTYTCLRINNHRLSLINAFILNSTVSLDEGIYEKVKKWVSSVKRLSTLVSQSGELQRMQFFRQQREFVDSL